MTNRKVVLAATSMLLGATNGHMFINSPTPIPGSAPKDPLDPSGSNFPCHGITLPKTGGQTMAAGSNQTLSFELADGANTATHGGGSCQISITYETDAAKLKDPNSWRVIHSMEGGCPTDFNGNVPVAIACTGANQAACVNSFPFTIPQGIKSGHAIMAWTWFNAVGNREMYMNCVNAQLTGGDGSEMMNFPAMFVANLASVNECPTTENFNVKFPKAGQYVTTKTEGNPYPLAVPTGAGCASDGGGSSSNSGYGANANNQAHKSILSSLSSSIITTSKVPSSQASSSSTHGKTASFPSVHAPVPSNPTPGTSFLSAPGSCTDNTVSCPTPGALICIDATHFGICDIDHCAVSQPVAPGTVCQNGAIAHSHKRAIEAHRRRLRASRHFGHGH